MTKYGRCHLLLPALVLGVGVFLASSQLSVVCAEVQLSQPTALSPRPPPASGKVSTSAQFIPRYAQLPLSFEANQGQTDSQVKFISRGSGYSLFLTPTEAVLALRQGSAKNWGQSPLSHSNARPNNATNGNGTLTPILRHNVCTMPFA